MKYPAMPPAKRKIFSQDGFSGGLNIRDNAERIETDQLSAAENVWVHNGLLHTRPGFRCDGENLCELGSYDDGCGALEATGAFVNIDGIRYDVAYCKVCDHLSFEDVHVFLVSEESVRPAGVISFNRVDDETFFVPQRCLFFAADPTIGGGIYAFCTATNCESETVVYDYTAYEISATFDEWLPLNELHYYVPTILMNGHGTVYDILVENGAIEPTATVELEEPNLLTGTFYAYFSSDGHSSEFHLPTAHLDAVPFICRIYETPTAYTEWSVPGDSTSATAAFGSVQVTLTVDRSNGTFRFTSAENLTDFPIRKMNSYPENNIRIVTSKEVPDGLARVIGSESACTFDSRLYLCGNGIRQNEICSSRLINPLYFPESSRTDIGENSIPVTALAVQNNRLIAFKTDEIYRISTKFGSEFAVSEVLIGAGSNFYKPDELTASLIHNAIGCDLKKTVRLCGNQLVWMNRDGCVYTLVRTTETDDNKVYPLSVPIDPFLRKIPDAALETAFAMDWDGYYLLVIGQKVFLMDYRVKGFRYSGVYAGTRESERNLSWYYWELPGGLVYRMGIVQNAKFRLCCTSPRRDYFVFGKFEGDSDRIPVLTNGEYGTAELPVKAKIATCDFHFGTPYRLKDADTLYLSGGSAEKLNVCLSQDPDHETVAEFCLPERQLQDTVLQTVPVHLNAGARTRFGITVSGTAPFYLGGLTYGYHERSEVR